ncbi:MAG: nucleotidyltransferase domain-containing protein [Thermoprotei archaeon]
MAELKELIRRLLEYDSNIVEVIQFGSSVYAPEYARDIDLLVITKETREYGGYLDAVNPKGSFFNVDVLVLETGKIPRPDLLRSILGSFKVLYGEGKFLLEYAKSLGDPSFKEARASLKAASDYFELSKKTEDPLVKDRHIREAFDTLFHASRIASMVYLSTNISRWGFIRRELIEPYKAIFNNFINILHIKYFYNGEYPKENLEKEFNMWTKKVEEYISNLESEVKTKQ